MVQNNRLGVIISGVATLGTIVIMTVFLYSNPYGEVETNTRVIVTFGFIFPTILSFFAGLRGRKLPMIICLLLSLPIGLYLGLAAIPSVWNLIIPILILHIAAITMIHK